MRSGDHSSEAYLCPRVEVGSPQDRGQRRPETWQVSGAGGGVFAARAQTGEEDLRLCGDALLGGQVQANGAHHSL